MNNEQFSRSSLHEGAEQSLQQAKEVIFAHIPKEEIVTIYGKGSYFRGDFQPGSDIDLVVVLKSDEYLPKLYTLTEDFGKKTDPQFQIVGYTVDELHTGKWAANRPKTTTRISRFAKYIDALPIIFGEKPEGELFTKSDESDLKANIDAFNKSFFPNYEAGTFKFKELVKQVFWLVEAELRYEEVETEYSWQSFAHAISDPHHIVHDALKFRNTENISEEEKAEFLNKLKEYVQSLEEELGRKQKM